LNLSRDVRVCSAEAIDLLLRLGKDANPDRWGIVRPSGPAGGDTDPKVGGNRSEGVGRKNADGEGYLGVRREMSYLLGREGLAAKVSFERSKIGWHLFLFFLEKRGEFASLEEISSVWRKGHGQAHIPSKSTIYDDISTMKQTIRPLNLSILNRKGVGYKLIDANGPEANPSSQSKERK
jgi:hypothetical protein